LQRRGIVFPVGAHQRRELGERSAAEFKGGSSGGAAIVVAQQPAQPLAAFNFARSLAQFRARLDQLIFQSSILLSASLELNFR